MKKILVCVLALVLTMSCMVGIFAACDSIDYEHTIVFYSSQGDKLKAITDIAIEKFEAKYPGWKVLHETPGGYDQVRDKVIADLQGQIQPDLAYCYPDHVAYYLPTEKVVNMTNLINSTEKVVGQELDEDGKATGKEVEYTVGYSAKELEDFLPNYYIEGRAENYFGYKDFGLKEDDMLTLPFVKSTELMYYNKEALSALNLEPARTWEELWAQCDKLIEAYPGCTPLGYDSEANWFIIMCEQNGWDYTGLQEGNHYLFDNENTRAWLQELAGYYEKHYFTTKQDYNGAYTSTLFQKGVKDNAGGCVYCIGSSGGASNQSSAKFTTGVLPVPGSANSTAKNPNAAISQGPSLVMLTGGNKVTNAEEKEKMTFLFIKELLDPDFQSAFSIESGYNTCRFSTYDDPTYKKHMDGDKVTAVAAKVTSTMSDLFFVSPAFEGSSEARTQVGTALLLAMTGVSSPEQALRDAVRNCGGNPNGK